MLRVYGAKQPLQKSILHTTKEEIAGNCHDKKGLGVTSGFIFSDHFKEHDVLHFCLSATGPLQQADSPQEISLKSM